MIDISFIMPMYKVADFLPKAVESALGQVDAQIEVILVDDGSPDASGAIADQYAAKDARVKVVHQQNAGSGMARNAGLAVASGEFIHFFDPDDYVSPDLASANLALARRENADIVVFGYEQELLCGDGSLRVIGTQKPCLSGVYSYQEFIGAYPRFFDDSHYLWNKLFRRALLADCKFTSRSIGQDALFNCEAYAVPFRHIAFNEKPYYHYVNREMSSVNRFHKDAIGDEFRITRANERLVEKWGRGGDRAFIGLLDYCRVRDLHLAIKNVTTKGCPYTQKERLKWLKGMMADAGTRRAVARVRFSRFPRRPEKVKLLLLKCHMYRLLLALNALRSDRSV